jgi:AGCS family alanine or glycine:cation symporter
VPALLKMIVQEAFVPSQAVVGGILGTIQMGVKRGLFSNEAGMGSAPNAAAAAHTVHPCTQGLIQSLGVFIDTLFINTCTALIILLANPFVAGSELSGITLTQDSFRAHISHFGPVYVAVLIFVFCYTTVIGNYFYAEMNIKFLKQHKPLLPIFKLMVVAMVFWGGMASLEQVWNLGDFFMALMTIINVVAIVLLSPILLRTLKDYEKKLKSKGPLGFKAEDIGLNKLEGWTE